MNSSSETIFSRDFPNANFYFQDEQLPLLQSQESIQVEESCRSPRNTNSTNLTDSDGMCSRAELSAFDCRITTLKTEVEATRVANQILEFELEKTSMTLEIMKKDIKSFDSAIEEVENDLVFQTTSSQQTSSQRDRKIYHEMDHLIFWLLASSANELIDIAKPQIFRSMRIATFYEYAQMAFLVLWGKIENDEMFFENDEQVSELLIQALHSSNSAEAILRILKDSREFRKVASGFIRDAQALRPLIKGEAWKDRNFMEELQRKVETVPLTELGLLDKTYRSQARKIVDMLKEMARSMAPIV